MKTRQALASTSYFLTLEVEANLYRFKFAAKKADFIFYFICFSVQGSILLRISFMKIGTLKVLISFHKKKMEWNKLYSNLATKYVYWQLCAHLKTTIRDHRSPMML